MQTSDPSPVLSKCVLAFALLPFLAIYDGFCCKIIWGWFMVPKFGLPAIDVPTAIGLGILASYFTHQNMSDFAEKENKPGFGGKIFLSVFKPSMYLFFAWIVNHWMR